jgi:hypothetical protein
LTDFINCIIKHCLNTKNVQEELLIFYDSPTRFLLFD